MELRSCLRSPLKLPIAIAFEGKEINCTTIDFSLGGMCLELDNTLLTAGAETKIKFSLTQDNREKKHMLKANIAYTKADCIGLSFSELDSSSFNSIKELLKFTRKQNLH